MTEKQIEDIYLTMQGQLMCGPWQDRVRNLYTQGSRCNQLYEEVYEAKCRLMERLGMTDEDEDVELIINVLLEIAQIHAYEMFRYGWKFAKTENNNTVSQ